MNKKDISFISKQLKKPSGENAVQFAEKMAQSNSVINMHVMDSIHLTRGSAILEVGMANAKYAQNLFDREPFISYTGIDYSNEMVSSAQQKYQDSPYSKQIKFLKGEADNLPITNKLYDYIVSVNTIYFFENLTSVFAHWMEFLKENGTIVIGIRRQDEMIHYPMCQQGFIHRSLEEIESDAGRADLKLFTQIEIPENNFVFDEVEYLLSTIILHFKKK